MWKRLHFPRDVVEGRTIHCEFLLVLNEVSLDHNMTHAFWCIAVCWFYNKSPKLENTDTVNNICPKRHHNEKLTCLWMLSMTWIASEVNLYCFIKCRFEQTEIIHPAAETSRASRSSLFFFFFDFHRRSPLSGLSQYGFDQIRDGSAALINLCHLSLVPVCRPLASWHPSEAGRLTAT